MGVTSFLLVSLGLAMTAQGQNCDKPVGGPNMSLRDTDILLQTFQDGSRVSFACDVGFESAGGSSVITCTAGVWSSVRLKCQKKNCGSPGEVENGHIEFPEGTDFGDKIVITCNDGYKFVGKQGPREIFCGDKGWDDRLPVCEAVSCYPPEPSADVTYRPNKDSYSYGEVVQYRCQQGLTLNGSNSASCSNEGTFDSDPPVCVKVQCEDFEVPNGDFAGGSRPPHEFQETVTYKCKSGFKMKGESTVTCDINSQWVPKLPECEVVTCKPPKTVANVTFSPIKDSYKFGEVVQYNCQKGFKLIGSNSVTCSIEGTFDSDPPVCAKVQCEDVEIPNGEKVGGSQPPYGHQVTVTYKCKSGFKLKGESTVTCDIDSHWVPKLPECELVTCKPPKTVANVMFSPIKDSYKFGEVVQYSCQKGFKLIGSNSVTCSIEGTFDSDPPVCAKVQCEDVEIPNGEKVGGSQPPYGHQVTVTYKCKSGFKLKGESTVTCDIDSQWVPKLPECELVTCKPPKNVADGEFTPIRNSYSFGEVVQYSCEQDFKLIGSKSLSCSQDGTFKPDPPKCTKNEGEDPDGNNGNRYVITLSVCLVVLFIVIIIVIIVGYRCGFLAFITKGSRRRSTDNDARKPDEAVPLS